MMSGERTTGTGGVRSRRIHGMTSTASCLPSKRSMVSAIDTYIRLYDKCFHIFVFSSFFDTAECFHILLGHTLVPKTYKTDQPLSSWVFRQRRQHGFRELGQRNSLSENRMKQLNDVS